MEFIQRSIAKIKNLKSQMISEEKENNIEEKPLIN